MVQTAGFHEDLRSRSGVAKQGSDRAFGLCIGVVLAVVGALEFFSADPSIWVGGMLWVLAGALVVTSLTLPGILAPLNKAWFRFALFLSKITNPIVTGIIFFAVITPAGLIMRAVGNPLGLKYDQTASSYWIVRDPPGPKPETMKYQF